MKRYWIDLCRGKCLFWFVVEKGISERTGEKCYLNDFVGNWRTFTRLGKQRRVGNAELSVVYVSNFFWGSRFHLPLSSFRLYLPLPLFVITRLPQNGIEYRSKLRLCDASHAPSFVLWHAHAFIWVLNGLENRHNRSHLELTKGPQSQPVCNHSPLSFLRS